MLITWDAGAAIAVGLLAVHLVLRRAGRYKAWAELTREAAIVFGIYAVWQWVGDFTVTHVTGAVHHAVWIWHLERDLHLPSEVSVQRLVLSNGVLVQLLNAYYDLVHVPALIVFLLWLYFRRRHRYAYWRNVGALVTLASVLIQVIPVAPPRLLPQLGFTDTAMQYGESVYAAGGLGSATQLAAMPSVHVAWSVFIAVAVISTSTSRWRGLILLHPALTAFVVVATGNHWWLDGIVGAALVPWAILMVRLAHRGRGRLLPAQLPESVSATPDASAAAIVTRSCSSSALPETRSSSRATRAEGSMS